MQKKGGVGGVLMPCHPPAVRGAVPRQHSAASVPGDVPRQRGERGELPAGHAQHLQPPAARAQEVRPEGNGGAPSPMPPPSRPPPPQPAPHPLTLSISPLHSPPPGAAPPLTLISAGVMRRLVGRCFTVAARESASTMSALSAGSAAARISSSFSATPNRRAAVSGGPRQRGNYSPPTPPSSRAEPSRAHPPRGGARSGEAVLGRPPPRISVGLRTPRGGAGRARRDARNRRCCAF